VSARFGAAAVVLLGVVALAAPLLAPHDVAATNVGPVAAPPSAEFPLGTDEAGRDVLSRVIGGTRVSVAVGLGATLLALLVAAVLGSIAATARRPVAEVIMRSLDVIMAFPAVIIAVCIAHVVRPGVMTTIGVIAAIYVPPLTRVVRANVLAQYGEDYVDAARAIGSSRRRILVKHVAINCAVPVCVFAATMVADAIVLESSLSFLGLGIQEPAPSWGNILEDGRDLVYTGGWWVSLFPGAAILISVLALNLCAEGAAEALAAPGRDTEHVQRPAAAAQVDVPFPVRAERDDLRDAAAGDELLRVDRLSIAFPEVYGDVRVVTDVSFSLSAGEVVGMVGESGCGKSLVGTALVGQLPDGAEREGRVLLRGTDLFAISGRRRRALLGAEIAIVYQDALSSLNPGMSAGAQLRQVCRLGAARQPAELLDLVGLPSTVLRAYPNQLSGGQRQRVLIALALARSPSILVADEPTTALDETVQAQVVELLKDLQRELGFSVLFISHDLALVREIASRVLVMYAGQLIEAGDVGTVIAAPRHPYTAGLVAAIRSIEDRHSRLVTIPGVVPSPAAFGHGCRFADRCARSQPHCTAAAPALVAADGRHLACAHPLEPDSDTAVPAGRAARE
jgi:peptide/nickel transport system permease protein